MAWLLPTVIEKLREIAEKRLIAFKNFFQGIEQQAFAKPARAREEVIFALRNQVCQHASLVGIAIIAGKDFGKRSNANRQVFAGGVYGQAGRPIGDKYLE